MSYETIQTFDENIWLSVPNEDVALANAAPELLEALEALLEGTCEAMSFLDTHLIEHLKPLADAAERAIAKAKGE